MLPIFSIGLSGLRAQELRVSAAAHNVANSQSTRGAQGGPYQRVTVVAGEQGGAMSAGVQAHLERDTTPGPQSYDPEHPDADAQGFVTWPNVDLGTGIVELVTGQRGYSMQLATLRAANRMTDDILDITG